MTNRPSGEKRIGRNGIIAITILCGAAIFITELILNTDRDLIMWTGSSLGTLLVLEFIFLN
jgi:hypoxanthine-guanine phosphoribosyltransferase